MKRVIASLFVAVPVLLSGCNAGPLEEGASEDVQELAALEQGVVELRGSGVLFDDSMGKVTYAVTSLNDPTKARFVIESAGSITWWKSLDLFNKSAGNLSSYHRMEIRDSVHQRQVDFLGGDMTDIYQVELWKAGAFNVGIKARVLELSKSTTLGKQITFKWERD